MPKLERLARLHRTTAIVLLNTLILFAVLNLLLYGAIVIRQASRPRGPFALPGFPEALAGQYPGMTEAEVEEMLRETWFRKLEFAPFVQFRERPFHGRFVNVDPDGIRRTKDQGSWPPDPQTLNVFLFGGSTTFGYGLPDDQTLASHLQDALSEAGLAGPVKVYNFGCGYYYSTQERILFEELLISGIVPDLAIFVDGLNELYTTMEQPVYSEPLRAAMNLIDERTATLASALSLWLPLGRAGLLLREKLEAGTDGAAAPDETDLARSRLERYWANHRILSAVGERFHVPVVFVWQPVRTFRYDMSRDLFPGEDFTDLTRTGYPLMEEWIRREPPGPNFLWSADLQEGLAEPLYVDRFHYSPRLISLLAAQIGEFVVVRGLLES